MRRQENIYRKENLWSKAPWYLKETFDDDLIRFIFKYNSTFTVSDEDEAFVNREYIPQIKSIEGDTIPVWFFFKQLHYAAITDTECDIYREDLLKVHKTLQQNHPELFIKWSDAATLYNCDKDDLDHLLDLKVDLSSNRIKMQRLLAGYALSRDKNNKLVKLYNCKFNFTK